MTKVYQVKVREVCEMCKGEGWWFTAAVGHVVCDRCGGVKKRQQSVTLTEFKRMLAEVE